MVVTMDRTAALDLAAADFDGGAFCADLARRLACPTESEEPGRADELRRYLTDEIAPALADLGAEVTVHDSPVAGAPPVLIGRVVEDPTLPTVLCYGHGDVVLGHEGRWRDGRDPWRLDDAGDRWYGRGTADNKGQHGVNLAVLAAVHRARGAGPRSGFNLAWLFEMGEEVGSPGFSARCAWPTATCSPPTCSSCSDGLRPRADWPNGVPRLSWRGEHRHRAPSPRGVRTTPATGVGCCGIRAPCSPTRSWRWSTRVGRDPGAPAATAAHPRRGRPPPRPARGRRRPRRPDDRRRLGRAGSHAGRAGVRLEHARGAAGLRRPLAPGRCDPAVGSCHPAAAVRGGYRRCRTSAGRSATICGRAASSRCTWASRPWRPPHVSTPTTPGFDVRSR